VSYGIVSGIRRLFGFNMSTGIGQYFVVFASTNCKRLFNAIMPVWFCGLGMAGAADPGFIIANWQGEQGLPQNTAAAIEQTPDGYLWIATKGGLVRFDGVEFRTFGLSEGLPTLDLSTVRSDNRGNLWVGTRANGLWRFAQGRFSQVADSVAGLEIRQIALADDGGILVGTDQGAFVVNESGKVSTEGFELLKGVLINDVCRGNSGSVWLGTDHGLFVYRSNHLITDPIGSNKSELHVASVLEASSGEVWLGGDGGFRRFSSSGEMTSFGSEDGLPPRGMVALAEAPDKAIWAGNFDRGLYRFFKGSFEGFRSTNGLPDEAIRTLRFDLEGNLWAGTRAGGLLRLRQRLVTVYGIEHGLEFPFVRSVYKDASDKIWVATDGGGFRVGSEGRWGLWRDAATEFSPQFAYVILPTQDQRLWLGTYGPSLVCLKGDRMVESYYGSTGLHGRGVQALCEDSEGAVWIAYGYGDLQRLKNGVLRDYGPDDGLVGDNFTCLIAQANGDLWVGSLSHGLFRGRHGKFERFTTSNGLPSDSIRTLFLDSEQRLWMGTSGGLVRWSENQAEVFQVKNGLPDNVISQILEDDSGHLWCGCNRGIFRVAKSALAEVANGRSRQVETLVLGHAEGMPSEECTGNYHPAGYRSRDGRLWFSTTRGLVVIDPRLPQQSPPPPAVRLEELLFDGQVRFSSLSDPGLTGVRSCRIPAEVRSVAIRYTGLNFGAPERIHFRYRLEGLKSEWQEVGQTRLAVFDRLPEGDYRFEVTAAGNATGWNQQPAMLAFVVLPPWWHRLWVRAAAVLLLLGIVIAGTETRVRRLKRVREQQQAFSRQLIESQETERKRIAAELHDSVGQDLLVIKNRADLGGQTAALSMEAGQQFAQISETASHVIQGVREITSNLRPTLLDHLGLTRALRSMAERVTQSSGIPVTVDLEPIDGQLPANADIHLYRIAQEALTNITKHSGASRATIHGRVLDKLVILAISDNGGGMDLLNAAGRGMGLGGIAERARLLGGSAECHSAPGLGTRWCIQVPCHGGPVRFDRS
jgi:signal transduction histidine kinase/ligand-binding sensor domain-containing protein